MIERLRKCITYTEFKVVRVLAVKIQEGNKFVVMREIAKEAGTSMGVCTALVGKLEIAGVLITKSLGAKGILVELIDKELFFDFVEGGIF